MARTKSDDGEMTVLRLLRDSTATEPTAAKVARALNEPKRVAGALPLPPTVHAEIKERAQAAGYEPAAVDAWLQPYPQRIDSDTEPMPDGFMKILRTVRVEYERRETTGERAERIANSLQGALVTNDEKSFTAYFRIPKKADAIEYPLIMLYNATWLIDVLDEQRRALVAACRSQGRSWADIALALGVTRASAWQRYSSPDE